MGKKQDAEEGHRAPEPVQGRETLKEAQEATHLRGAGHVVKDRPEQPPEPPCECEDKQ